MALKGEGQVYCNTIEQWREHMEREKTSQKLVVVDFFAKGCNPCRMAAPMVAEFAKLMPEVLFLKVDYHALRDVAEEYKVEAMPHFVFLREGKMVDRIVGAKKDQLQDALENHSIITS